MTDPSKDPAKIGVADIDAGAATSWLAFSGLGVGLIPLALLVGVILLAVEGPVIAGGVTVLVVLAAVVVARARRP